MKKLSRILFVGAVLGSSLFAQQQQQQQIATSASSTDWEEVNFETNQSVIVDGFPSLLRVAELLKAHPDYKVAIVGHADQRGSARRNQTLSVNRANAVSSFLQKYGVAPAQITSRGEGVQNLSVQGRDINSLFVNRRVAITVTGPDGRIIGDGSIGRLIEELNTYIRTLGPQIQQMQSQIGQLNTSDIKQDTTQIRQDTASIKQDTSAIKQDTTAIRQDTGTLVQRPAPLSQEQTTKIAQDAADYALTQSAIRNRKYSQIGFAGGPTFGGGRVGDFNVEVFAKALIPFGNGKTQEMAGTHGFQVDGNWLYNHRDTQANALGASGLSDAIFSAGLVNRFGHVQVGTFAQFDYASVSLNRFLPNNSQVFSRGSAMLGGGVVTVNYVVNHGTIGIFGSRGFNQTADLSSTGTSPLINPRYLRYADQAGISGAGTFGRFQLEASVAFVKRHLQGADQQPAASLKLSFGPSDTMQFFVAADSNVTLNGISDAYRAVIGIQFGNWTRARSYGETQGVVPVTVPRPHYELMSR